MGGMSCSEGKQVHSAYGTPSADIPQHMSTCEERVLRCSFRRIFGRHSDQRRAPFLTRAHRLGVRFEEAAHHRLRTSLSAFCASTTPECASWCTALLGRIPHRHCCSSRPARRVTLTPELQCGAVWDLAPLGTHTTSHSELWLHIDSSPRSPLLVPRFARAPRSLFSEISGAGKMNCYPRTSL